MNIAQEVKGAFAVVGFDGRLDIMQYDASESAVNGILESSGVSKLLFDCEKLTFVSSAGLRLFMITLKKLNAKGGVLAISGMNPAVRKIFDITGYDKLFKIFDSCEQAESFLAG